METDRLPMRQTDTDKTYRNGTYKHSELNENRANCVISGKLKKAVRPTPALVADGLAPAGSLD